LHNAIKPKESSPIDNGSGKLKIWRIVNFKKEDVQPKYYGEFFSGDSYVILYTYKPKNREDYIIYFWQGRDSSQDEKATSAFFATQLDDELGGRPTHIRVVQNKEPNHFVTLFKGNLVIHKGGTASGFKNRNEQDSYDTDGVSLYHIRGTGKYDTHAVQVDEFALSLNSGDSFTLLTPKTQYVWYGKGSNTDERTIALQVAKKLQQKRTLVEIDEGSEPEEFWTFLGGKQPYTTTKYLQANPREARLFRCSNATGAFRIEEIYSFIQDDLEEDDVFLLDTYNELFVWVGKSSNAYELKLAFITAASYIKSATDGRSENIPVIRVESGHEPAMFTAFFLGWDGAKAASFEDPYERKLKELGIRTDFSGTKNSTAAIPSHSLAALDCLDPEKNSFPFSQLRGKLPQGVDPSRKELYLSDTEFKKLIGIDKSVFSTYPNWKQTEIKKKFNLF